jgi:glycosyltransferase involved in cell wall biosynthesis
MNQLRVAYISSILAKFQYQQAHLDGIGIYSQELLKHLTASQKIAITQLGYKTDIPKSQAASSSIRTTQLGFKVSSAWSYLTGLPTPGINQHLKNIDLVHCPDHCIPLVNTTPLVASIMDVIPLTNPEFVTSSLRYWKTKSFEYLAKRAKKIITISDFSACEIEKHLRIPREKISVTPLAVSEEFFDVITESARSAVLTKYGITTDYFLFVGTIAPRKNVDLILDAYEALPDELKKQRKLLIVGREGPNSEQTIRRLKQSATNNHVQWLNYVPRSDLYALLQSASCLVYPSLYEGFGLPILEAFASSIPVISSNTTAVPEVAGEFAYLIDPKSKHELIKALQKYADLKSTNPELLIQANQYARSFTWRSVAKKTMQIYEQST